MVNEIQGPTRGSCQEQLENRDKDKAITYNQGGHPRDELLTAQGKGPARRQSKSQASLQQISGKDQRLQVKLKCGISAYRQRMWVEAPGEAAQSQ